MIRWRRLAFATIALSGLVLSCQLIVGIRDDNFVVDAPRDAAPETSPTTPPCSAPLPSKHAGGGDAGTYTFALQTIHLGGVDPTHADGVPGFDLDQTCTCAPSGPDTRASCKPSPNAPRDSGCDLDGGIDNSLSTLTGPTGEAIDPLNGGMKAAYDCGRANVVFFLQSYNGLADDDDVQLVALPSYGMYEAHAGEPDAGAGGPCDPTYAARYDGTDRWFIDKIYFDNDGRLNPSSFAGYVSGWRLVVDGRSQAGGQSIPVVGLGSVTLGYPVLTAHLVADDGGFRVDDGLMAGRTSVKDALRGIGEFVPTDDTDRYCANGEWSFFQTKICASADLMSAPGNDFSGASCDAVSLVVRFTASPVLFKSGDKNLYTLPVGDAAACDDAALVCP